MWKVQKVESVDVCHGDTAELDFGGLTPAHQENAATV